MRKNPNRTQEASWGVANRPERERQLVLGELNNPRLAALYALWCSAAQRALPSQAPGGGPLAAGAGVRAPPEPESWRRSCKPSFQ
jgi:hypothetical protein